MLPTDVTDLLTLFTDLCKELVDDPTALAVEAIAGSQSLVFELRCAQEDVKRIIGRRGHCADALRELLTNVAAKSGRRCFLEVIEPDRSAAHPPAPSRARVPSTSSDRERVIQVFARLCAALCDASAAVRVEAISGVQSTVLVVDCDPDDVRRLIGRGGRTVSALRELLVCLSGKLGHKLILEITEPVLDAARGVQFVHRRHRHHP